MFANYDDDVYESSSCLSAGDDFTSGLSQTSVQEIEYDMVSYVGNESPRFPSSTYSANSHMVQRSDLSSTDVDQDQDLFSVEHKLLDELRSAMTEPSRRGKVKRPLNPFMVFSRVERSRLNNTEPGMNNAKLSKILGEKWRALTDSAKQPYIRCADRLKDLHKEMFPDYKYEPQKKGTPLPGLDDNNASQGNARLAYGKTANKKRKLICDNENQHRRVANSFSNILVQDNQMSTMTLQNRSSETIGSVIITSSQAQHSSKAVLIPLSGNASSDQSAAKVARIATNGSNGHHEPSFFSLSRANRFTPSNDSFSFRFDQITRRDLTRAQPGRVINVTDLVTSNSRSSPIFCGNSLQESEDVGHHLSDNESKNLLSNDQLAAAMETCGLPMDESSLSSFVSHVGEREEDDDREVERYNTNNYKHRVAQYQHGAHSSPGPMLSESSRDYGIGSELLSDMDYVTGQSACDFLVRDESEYEDETSSPIKSESLSHSESQYELQDADYGSDFAEIWN